MGTKTFLVCFQRQLTGSKQLPRTFSSWPISHSREEQLRNEKEVHKKKRLDIAIVGLPNAGKSQILNVLSGGHVSAVSHKRHTTVKGILASRTQKNTQLLFVDTPGFLRKGDAVDRNLMSATSEIVDVDKTLIVVDAARKLTDDVRESILQLMLLALESNGRVDELRNVTDSRLQKDRAKFAVVLNKVDLVHPKSQLLELSMKLGALAEQCLLYSQMDEEEQDKVITSNPKDSVEEFDLDKISDDVVEFMPTFFYVCAKKKDDKGMADLLDYLLGEATPCAEWELEPEEVTTLTLEERVEEVVREKLFRYTHQELPYTLKQENRLFRVIPIGKEQYRVVVHQDILVDTKSQQTVVRGKGNRTLEHIRSKAQADLRKLFQSDVDLHINVKVIRSQHGSWSI